MMLDCLFSNDTFIHVDVDVGASNDNDESPLKMIMLMIHTMTKSTVWWGFIKSNEVTDENDDDGGGDNYDGDNPGDEKMTMKLDFLIRTKEQCESRKTSAEFARRVSPIVRV